MAYHLELYNNTNASRLGYFAIVSNVRAVIELEGEDRLSFNLLWDDKLFDTVAVRNYVRIVNDVDSADYRSYIIQNIDTEKSGNLAKTIDCEGLKYALMDNIIEGKKPYAQITMTTALTIALAGSGFTLGTVDASSSNLRDIEFDWHNSLEALQLCIDTWTYEDGGVTKKYYYDITKAKVVNVREIGNLKSEKYFYIHSDKNMESITKTVNTDNMGNKIYAIGADGFSIYRANKTNYEFNDIVSIAGGGGDDYITVAEEGVVDNEFDGTNIYIYAETGYGQIREITDSMAPAGLRVALDWTTNPDATSKYCAGAAIVSTPCVYELGQLDANSQCAALGTYIRVLVGASCYWTGIGSGNLTSVIKVELLDSSNNVITSDIQELVRANEIATTLTTDNLEFLFSVANMSTIKKVKMTLVSATFDGDAEGRPFCGLTCLTFSLSNNLAYIPDSTSISSYGTVVDKYENTNIIDTINLVSTPALDGTYTDGLCENWTSWGAPTFAENTNPAYIRHGTKSQKVTNMGSGDGIQSRVYLNSNIPYSAYILIYIDSTYPGSITITLDSSSGEADCVATVTGAGWIEIKIENFSYDFGDLTADESYVDLRITSNGTDAVYYPDAAQINEGVECKPFVDGDSADVLYAEALAYLKLHKDPGTTYNIDMANLYEIDPARYSGESFAVGDQVRVVDRDLVLDSNLICVRKEYNPYDPKYCVLQLDNKRAVFKNSFIKATEIIIRRRK